MQHSPALMACFIGGAALIVFAVWRFIRDRRRPESSIFLLIGLILVYLGTVQAVHRVNEDLALILGAGAIFGVLLPSVPLTGAALIANGVVVMRREGVKPGTVLPLFAGAGAFLLMLGVPLAFGGGDTAVAAGGLLVLLGYAYLGFLLIVYGVHALLYARWPIPRRLDAVVVLGAGLAGEEVTPLLAGRVVRGVDVARRCRGRAGGGTDPVLVMSGGQGPDELVAEADAMARHAAANGWGEPILLEDESTTTLENLRFSARLLEARGLGSDSRVMVVTSDFHVLRAAALARAEGLLWQVAGAPTARYYVPTAFLREFVAWLAIHKRVHGAVGAVFVALAALLALV